MKKDKVTLGKILLCLLGISVALSALGIYPGTAITVVAGVLMIVPLAKALIGKK